MVVWVVPSPDTLTTVRVPGVDAWYVAIIFLLPSVIMLSMRVVGDTFVPVPTIDAAAPEEDPPAVILIWPISPPLALDHPVVVSGVVISFCVTGFF